MATKTHSKPRRKSPARKSAGRRAVPKTARASKKSPDLQQIVAMLEDDHSKVDKLFKKIEKMKDAQDNSRHALVKQVCTALKAHAALEEEAFYPAARDVLADEDEMVDEAEVEHASAKQLIADIEQLETSDPMYDAKVKVLSEYIKHHVEEEEGEMFPKLKKKADDQFDGLFAQMKTLRAALEADLSAEKGKPKTKRAGSGARKSAELS
jgi:hemerythrin superfamily protein